MGYGRMFFFFVPSAEQKHDCKHANRGARLVVYCGLPEGGASAVAMQTHFDFEKCCCKLQHTIKYSHVQLCVTVRHGTLFSTFSLREPIEAVFS